MKRKRVVSAYLTAFGALVSGSGVGAQDVPTCQDGTLFTNLGNSFVTASNNYGSAIGASEASTAQVLEVVAQRRIEEQQSCPAGFVRVNGACQRQTAQSAPKSSSTVRTAAQRSPVQRQASPIPVGPEQQVPSDIRVSLGPNGSLGTGDYGAWAEAFADWEKHTGTTRQTQRAAGAVFGFDRTFKNNNSTLQLGLIGGFANIRQSTGEFTRTESRITDYFLTLPGGSTIENNGDITYKYPLATDHTIVTSSRQNLHGLNLGFSAALSAGGFFSDFVGKVDFFDLRHVGRVSDTFNSRLHAGIQAGSASGGVDQGCLNRNTPITFSDPVTESTVITQNTTLQNYVFADRFGYRFELKGGYWFEPVGSIRFIVSDYGKSASTIGLKDGNSLRLEAGSAIGKGTLLNNGSVWVNSLGAYIYSDVLVNGLVITTGGVSSATDEGKLRARGVFRSQVYMANGLSLYGETGARVGRDYWGYNAKLGARLEW